MKIKKSKISSPKKLRANLLAKLRSIRRTTLQSKTRPKIIRRSRYRQYESDSDSDSDSDTNAKRSIKTARAATSGMVSLPSTASTISVVTGGIELPLALLELVSFIKVRESRDEELLPVNQIIEGRPIEDEEELHPESQIIKGRPIEDEEFTSAVEDKNTNLLEKLDAIV